MLRHLLWVACASLIAAPALGAPSYTLTFQPNGVPAAYNVTQSTPFYHEDTFPVGLNGSGTSTFSGSAFAFPGHVGVQDRLETHWTGVSAGSRCDVDARATATDFIITGPAGPTVAGQLHLRARAKLEHVGGFAGNASHGARVNVDVRARFGAFVATGDLTSSNFDTHGFGIMAGLTDPELDFPFVLSGTFPVGTPFDVVMRMFTVETTYGNGGVTPNPGYVLGDAASRSDYGLFLEEVSGQVMTLPAGYTLNSVSWGITDNHFSSTVGVATTEASNSLRLDLSGANPSSGAFQLGLTLPRAGHVAVEVFDASGRRVRALGTGWRPAGRSEIVWDGLDEGGRSARAGLYFVRADSDGRRAVRRLVRVR